MGKNKKPVGLTIGKAVLMGFLSLTLIFFSIIFIFLNFYTPSFPIEAESGIYIDLPSDIVVMAGVGGDMTAYTTAEDVESLTNKGKTFCNVLICGDSGGNTDTIMVASFDVKNGELSVLSIPRDTYIETTASKKRINAVYARGYNSAKNSGKNNKESVLSGMKDLGAVINYTLGIQIHCSVYIDTAGFRELVDLANGIEVNVPIPMYYNDPTPGESLYIDLQPGLQTLKGEEAEGFVRFRKGDEYGYDDYDRMGAQQQAITALLKKCMSQPTKIPQFINTGYKYIVTDLNAADTLYFAKEIAKLKPENIRFNTAPSEAKLMNGAWYVVLYKEETMQIVNKYHNWYKEDLPPEKFNIVESERAAWNTVNIDGVTMDQMSN